MMDEIQNRINTIKESLNKECTVLLGGRAIKSIAMGYSARGIMVKVVYEDGSDVNLYPSRFLEKSLRVICYEEVK